MIKGGVLLIPNSGLMKLDRIDVAIVEILQKDGRRMYKEIAEELGVSLPTVRARVKKLVELGVIKKFTVIVNPDKIVGKIRTLLMIQANTANLQDVIKRLSELKQIREVYVVAGGYTLAAKGDFRDVSELGEITSKVLPSIPGLQGVTCSVITDVPKEEYGSAVEPEAVVQFKCEFCGSLIFGKPVIEEINGGRYFFSGKECAEAYRERLGAKKKIILQR